MLVAGCENSGDNLEVIKKSRSRRFFLCRHEYSPSTSVTARQRFLGRGGNGRGGKESVMARGAGATKVKTDLEVSRARKGKSQAGPEEGGKGGFGDVDEGAGRFMLLQPTFFAVCRGGEW